MKRFLLASALCMGVYPAMAQVGGGGLGGPLTNGNFQDGVNAAISGSGNSTSTSSATGGLGGAGGAGGLGGTGGVASSQTGASTASGTSNANGNVSNSNTFTSPSNLTVRSVPSVSLGMGTAYCQNSAGVGGSGVGFSFQAMMGRHDADCIRYNNALALQALGDPEAAILVLSNNREVNAAVTESRRRRAAAQAQTVQAASPAAPLPRPSGGVSGLQGKPSSAKCAEMRRGPVYSDAHRDYINAACS